MQRGGDEMVWWEWVLAVLIGLVAIPVFVALIGACIIGFFKEWKHGAD